MVAKRLILVSAVLATAGCDRGVDEAVSVADAPAPAFVGGAVCGECHRAQAGQWLGSQHDLAMQQASGSTVLGDFDDVEVQFGGVTTRFTERDGRYFVSTDGPDGERAEFAITYTFGVEPLQQYLIELDDGKWQALSIAWDSRPAAAGGQRWFHLYSDDIGDYRDPLHWTGVYQRWNTMCADCHSTNLHKGYDTRTDTFASRWSSLDVACEACHGPGSEHAADPAVPPEVLPDTTRAWTFAPGESIAQLAGGARQESAEIEVCARCHSRRTQLTDDYLPGEPLLDAFRPVLLDAGLYHADGQIQDEVYVYGSFLQSKMAAAGVICTDCHEPHSTRLRAEGNAVCAQCHLPTTYDRTKHHRHEAGTAAAECTSCHMRSETYMVVDPRRDHSFRVPRPDLTIELDSPNACNDCHTDQPAEWAQARIEEWYPEGRWTRPHYGQVLHGARSWQADARERLLQLIAEDGQPAIVRATAVSLLADRMTVDDAAVLARVLDSDEPLLQLAAIDAAGALEPARRIDLVQRFLSDDRLAIRTAAAGVLMPARDVLSERRRSDLDAALEEYRGIQMFNADRPEGLLNASVLAVNQGRLPDAEELLLRGLERYSAFPALYINLADLYRQTGRGDESEAMLRAGLERNSDDAGLSLALAYALVRNGRTEEAGGLIESAAELAPDQPYYQYVRAIYVSDSGDRERAIELLRAGHEQWPGYPDFLVGLATMLRDAGDIEQATEYARRLVALRPGDAAAANLLAGLRQPL